MDHDRSITYFDRVSAIGSRILAILGSSPTGSKADDYLGLVAQIYSELAQIHDSLIDVTIDVSQAQTTVEATQALERVQQMGLKRAMQALKMCDDLEQLGKELRKLPDDTRGLTKTEKADWDELCRQLEEREGGTSRLYDEKLYDLRVLRYTDLKLEPLKAKVEEISSLLVIQKAQFEYLAKLANAVLARRT